jgi:hypothetical protein
MSEKENLQKITNLCKKVHDSIDQLTVVLFELRLAANNYESGDVDVAKAFNGILKAINNMTEDFLIIVPEDKKKATIILGRLYE